MSSAAALIDDLDALGVTFQADDDKLVVRAPMGVIDSQTDARLKQEKPQLIAELTEAAMESRYQELMEMMDEDTQRKKYYWVTDTKSNPRFVILAGAIRGVADYFEMRIPRERYDPFLLMKARREMEGYTQ